jgi:hypothetical protein
MVAPALSGYPLVVLTNALERLPFVVNKIAADGGLHAFRNRSDLNDMPTTVPVPVQYNFFQKETSSEVVNTGLMKLITARN